MSAKCIHGQDATKPCEGCGKIRDDVDAKLNRKRVEMTLSSIPWIDYGRTWKDFCREGLNKPGVQVTIEGIPPMNMLLGETNVMGGVCDCCCSIRDKVIIARYRVLVDPSVLA